MSQHTHVNRRPRWRVALLILGIVVVLGVALFQPWNVTSLQAHPQPAQNYAEALQRIDRLRSQETAPMNPVCQVQLLTHERKVARAIVLVHGYTNCPHQFHALGQQFYDLGYNVLIAPMPHHGLADRMTEAQSQLTGEELTTYADSVVDIAHGLGEHVTMLGISAGGATTAWAAQNRADIDLAVIVSPAFGFKPIPTPLTVVVMNIYSILPDSYDWWDPVQQINGGMKHTYPRYSKHGLAQTLRLSFAVQVSAQRQAPAAHKLIVVTNANDDSVNNPLIMDVIHTWQAHGANLTTYEFPADLHLGHDLIDPAQPNQQIGLVYPRLLELVNQ